MVTRGSWIQCIQELARHEVPEAMSEVTNSCFWNENVNLVFEVDVEAVQELTTVILTTISEVEDVPVTSVWRMTN